jgi:hypothetical protein
MYLRISDIPMINMPLVPRRLYSSAECVATCLSMPATGMWRVLTIKTYLKCLCTSGGPWHRVQGRSDAVRISSALCIRNVWDLHNNHSDRACGRVIEMDLRTSSKSLRVHVTGR